ncbi:MAG: HD domain-containing protein [Fibrobacter sp.]|nr:HD domain-containing protein [Fibrobacter sp.]
MVIYYLAAALVLSFVNIIIFMIVCSKRMVSYYLSMFHVITMAIAGHFMLAMSTNIEEALLANKFAYAGAVYIPLLFFLGELSLCNINISKKLRIVLFAASTVVLAFAMTTGWSDVFYKSTALITHHGVTDYTVDFGPAHILYNMLLTFYLVSGLVVFVYSLLKKKNISYRNLLALAAIGLLGVGTFFICRELGYDMLVMPAIYLIIEYIMLIITNRISKYDISGSIQETLEFQNESTFISITEDLCYIGCNNVASRTFPSLKNFRVDSKLPSNDELSKIILNIIENFDPQQLFKASYFEYGSKHYKCTIRNLLHGQRHCGYMLRIEDDSKIQRYIKLLDKYNNDLVTDVQNKNEHIQAIQEQMILGMSNMVESRDSNTGSHIRHTSQAVKILVNEMKKDEIFRKKLEFFKAIIKSAPMHDLGKIAVDDAILRKPGTFTQEEFNIMKTHAQKGAVIVENLLKDVESDEFVTIASNVAHYHHERWDGTGYPKQLRGEEIPLEARIMAIADVYDALVSKRCYKEKMSYAEAFDIIVSSMGTHFDPMLKKYFINCHKELENFYDSCED